MIEREFKIEPGDTVKRISSSYLNCKQGELYIVDKIIREGCITLRDIKTNEVLPGCLDIFQTSGFILINKSIDFTIKHELDI